MLEDEFQNKKSQMRWDLRENNQSLVSFYMKLKNFFRNLMIFLYEFFLLLLKAKERKDKEDFLKEKKLHYEKTDLNNMIEKGQKQPYP